MAFTRVSLDADDTSHARTSRRLADILAELPPYVVHILIGTIRAEVRCDDYDRAHLLPFLAEDLDRRIQPLIRRSDLTRDLRRPLSGW